MTTKAGSSGWRIGPPAERLYAVDPVGVATMTPSARNRATGFPATETENVEIRAIASLFKTASFKAR